MKYKSLVLLSALLFFGVAAHADEPMKILVLEFTVYGNDSVTFSDYYVDTGIPTVFGREDTGYRVVVYSRENSLLNEAFFLPALEAMTSGGAIATKDPRAGAYVRLRLPYDERASRLELYRGGSMIFRLDLSGLCEPDGLCSGHENGLSCPSDCSQRQGVPYCDREQDGVCDLGCFFGWDPDCAEDATPKVKEGRTGFTDYLVYLAVFALLLLLIAFPFLGRKMNRSADFILNRRHSKVKKRPL